MTATNHVITGALIVALVPNHWVALPLALLSHVALDVLPHFGFDNLKGGVDDHLRIFIVILLSDMAIAASILLVLLLGQPLNYGWLIAGGITGASPDLLSIPHFIDLLKKRPYKPGWLQSWLGRIQWSQTTPGIAIEAVWFLLIGNTLLNQLS